jgi:type I restriction enzyme S subunit
MIEWKLIKISDLGKVVTGNTPPRKNPEYYGEHTIFIKPTDISEDEKYTYQPEECYSDLGFRKYKSSLIPTGSTCVVTIGSIGKKITKAHCDCFINQAMNAVIPNDNFDQEFVFYVLKYNLGQLKMLDSGTASGRENVSKSSFANIKINVPKSKDVQSRIGKILASYDDLIENNFKRIKILEEIAQRTYEEWFVKFRVNGEQLPMDEATGLPVGWKLQPFNTIVEIISGYPFKSSDYVEDGKFKIVTIKNVQDGYFVPETTDSLFEIPTKVKAEQVLNTSDIIVSLTGNVGRICLVYGDNYLLNQRVAKVVPLVEYSKAYVYFLLRSKAMITSLENLSNGAAQQNLSPINMGNMKVNIPDKKLIEKFGELGNRIIDLISKLNLENQKLKQSRDILLPRLMSGTLNVES